MTYRIFTILLLSVLLFGSAHAQQNEYSSNEEYRALLMYISDQSAQLSVYADLARRCDRVLRDRGELVGSACNKFIEHAMEGNIQSTINNLREASSLGMEQYPRGSAEFDRMREDVLMAEEDRVTIHRFSQRLSAYMDAWE